MAFGSLLTQPLVEPADEAKHPPIVVSEEDFQAFWKVLQDRVPYAKHIQESDARSWQKQVMEDALYRKGHPVEWHVRRLGNPSGPLVGGSEIGVLVSAYRRLAPPFGKTPGILFDEKMLKTFRPSNIATTFGSKHEAALAQQFMEHVRAMGWKRDESALSSLRDLAKDGGFREGMAYSPDDIFLTPQGKRFLIDYKIPYSGIIPEKEPFPYVAQLHQGKMVLERQADLPVDGMLLVYGEHPQSLARSTTAMEMHFYRVDHDESVDRDIRIVVPEFCAAVMEGRRPSVLEPSEQERLQALDRRYVWLTAQMRYLQDHLDGVKREMEYIVSNLPVAARTGANEEMRCTLASRYKSQQPEQFLSILADADPGLLTPDRLKKWTKPGELDMQKVRSYLEAQGVLEDFRLPDTLDLGNMVKDSDVLASGAVDEALRLGILESQMVFQVSKKAMAAVEEEVSSKGLGEYDGSVLSMEPEKDPVERSTTRDSHIFPTA